MPTIYLLPQCGDPEAEGECLQTVFPHALTFFFCVNNPGSGTTSDRWRRAFRPCKRARATGKTNAVIEVQNRTKRAKEWAQVFRITAASRP
jgi:hypothetical protein